MGLLGFIKDYVLGFWDYETPKVMIVKNKPLGVIYRGVQFLVLTYFIWYVFIKEKAYQQSETRPESSVHTKMRGTAVQGDRVHDTIEYAHPSEGFDVISTTVRREVTYDQMQQTCAEHFSVASANCTKDSDCTPGEVNFNGNGRRTGRCVPYYDQNFKTCEIQAWCPVEEYAAVREPPLLEAANFTVFIGNTIRFPAFNVTRGNIKVAPNKRKRQKYLSKCHYDEKKEPYCPIFRLGYIADQARENFDELCKTGGVIGVFINWQCNFDVDASDCKPTYSFRLLDTRKDLPTAGYYYRFAKYYSRDGVESRTLIKAYGIRLDIIVHGYAGKFSLIPTIINSVTAMGSIGICSIICDWIMLTFIDKNGVYSEKKFVDARKDAIQPMSTAFTIVSYGSNHSDLSDGVPL
ncbi:P2X purinoceptor 2 [Merluccius polli]|uniref:P2X purinoceptor n=1 Tax=Merluccius polli TaxID=89951 RepID=A0AA47PAW9_MERPO|nr:P2X purinoceptor 2 [Merluccius polli]